MGSVIGFVGALGCVLVAWALLEPQWTPAGRARNRAASTLRGLLDRAGAGDLRPRHVYAACWLCAMGAAAAMTLISGVVVVGIVFGCLAAPAPVAVLRARAARRQREYALMWPDAVDNLTSAVRAGLSLPEALTQLGERGPQGMREPFVQFGRDYQASGRFGECLDRLKVRLADPVGDRVVEALRLAREVGGGDLGRMLRSLSAFLRDDVRTRGELESRQSWTVNAARLAVAAPWIVLALMSFQGDVVSRFGTPTGAAVLATGAITCAIAYRLMMWIGKLPVERRILQ
jgi:tight adherence protein B